MEALRWRHVGWSSGGAKRLHRPEGQASRGWLTGPSDTEMLANERLESEETA
jgi:hypothetical protein